MHTQRRLSSHHSLFVLVAAALLIGQLFSCTRAVAQPATKLFEPPLPVVQFFAINNDAPATTSRLVTLNNIAVNYPADFVASEDPDFDGAKWQIYDSAPSFTLSIGLGVKTVYFKVRNATGESDVLSDAILLVDTPVVAGFEINDGDAMTNQRIVILNNSCTGDPTEYIASESSDFAGAVWSAYDLAPVFMLSPGNGEKTVYFKVRNLGAESAIVDDDIDLVEPPEIITFAVNDDDASTWSRDVTLNLQCSNAPTHYMASEDPGFSDGVWAPYSSAPPFILSPTDGPKIVYVTVKNDGGESAPANDAIVLDEVLPPAIIFFAINNDDAITEQRIVSLDNACENGPTEYLASESPDFSGASWQPYALSPDFNLTSGDGVKSVYFKVRNIAGESDAATDDIFLDEPPPPPVIQSFAINNGAAVAALWDATLNNTCVNGPTEYIASEDPGFSGAVWLPYDVAPPFELSTGNGTKEVFFKVRNAGGESNVASDTIELGAPVPPLILSFLINDVDAETDTRDVMLTLVCSGGPTHCMVSESPAFAGADWQSFQDAMPFMLSEPTGTKVVYAKVMNLAGESAIATDSILYALPTPPELVSMQINNGDAETLSRLVAVQTVCTNNPTRCWLSEDPATPGVWINYAPDLPFVLSPGNGEKTVYFLAENEDGDTGVHSDSIILNVEMPPQTLSFRINNGATKTDTRNVTLNSVCDGNPAEFKASESFMFGDTDWQPYDNAAPFVLSEGLGTKLVYFIVRNEAGVSVVVSDTIDVVNPGPPELASMVINDNAQSTTSRIVTLNNVCSLSPAEYIASEDPTFAGAEWAPYDPAPLFTLTAGGGKKFVYFTVRNQFGQSEAASDSIMLNESQVPVLEAFAVNGDAATTSSRDVILNHQCAHEPTLYMASERPDFYGAMWEPYESAPVFRLKPQFGMKTVYFKVRNAEGESNGLQDDIEYVSLAPTIVSFTINNDDAGTESREVELNSICLGEPQQCLASESASFAGAHWAEYAPTMNFTLSEGAGAKTVYFKVRNESGQSTVFADTIELEGCTPPEAPTGVEATNWERAWIYVVWNAVPGDDVEYMVYGNGAARSGWLSQPIFADLQNIECSADAHRVYTVVARNHCGMSAPGGPATGIGRANNKIVAPTGLMVNRGDGVDFALKWRHYGYALANSLTMSATLDGVNVPGSWSWWPDQGDVGFGWMVFHPAEALPAEGSLYVAGSALALQQQFMVATNYTFDLSNAADVLMEPEVTEVPPGTVPPIDPVSGAPVYDVTPHALFLEPVTVQIPIPEGLDASSAELWYHGEADHVVGWCRGQMMYNWIVPGSRQVVTIDSQTYLQFDITFGGVIQLSAPKSKVATAGTCAFAVLVLTVFVFGGKNSPMRRKHFNNV